MFFIQAMISEIFIIVTFLNRFETVFKITFKIIKKQFIDSICKRRLTQFYYNLIKKEIVTF